MVQTDNPTAGMVIIGNEILSGRTQDTNGNFLGKALTKRGISLREVRVVPDDEALIVEAVTTLSQRYDTVFTTGGIGPTHDDITAACIAKAFDQNLILHPEAHKTLLNYYGEENLTEVRLKMAKLPEHAELIPNPVTGAPGFRVENVYVMAGVPKIMQSMLESILPKLKGGTPLVSLSLTVDLVESQIADALTELQDSHPAIDIGSYPSFKEGQKSVSVVLRAQDKTAVEALGKKVEEAINDLGGSVLERMYL